MSPLGMGLIVDIDSEGLYDASGSGEEFIAPDKAVQ
jgi:hypothetical protein